MPQEVDPQQAARQQRMKDHARNASANSDPHKGRQQQPIRPVD
ncbi:MAG: hypothetical protein ABIR37_01010 [Candidatus Saccharimonadales bacterium]